MIDRSLNGLYPVFKNKIIQLKELLVLEKIPCDIFETIRPFERCQELWMKGRVYDEKTRTWKIINKKEVVTNAIPGFSFHTYGLATDFVFDGDISKAGMQWSWDNKFPWKRLGYLAESLGLVWGGNFKKFPDPPHIQYKVNWSIQDIYSEYTKRGLPGVWKLLDILKDRV